MKRILVFFGMSAGSWVGWWLGNFVGLTTALVLSGIGGVVGVFVTIKLGQAYLE